MSLPTTALSNMTAISHWWLDSITDSTDMNLSQFQAIVKDRGVRRATVRGDAKSRTQLSDNSSSHTWLFELI